MITECADSLVYELRRMKSTNTTRRYLGTVVDVLSSLSYEVVKERLEALAEDKSFSHKMRRKFIEALERAWHHAAGY